MLISNFLTSLDRRVKLAVLLVSDAVILILSVIAAYALRISDLVLPPLDLFASFYSGPPLSLLVLYFFSVYHSVSRVYSARTELKIVQAQIIAVLLWAFFLTGYGFQGFPRSVLIIYFVISVFLLILWRRTIAMILSRSLPVVRAVEPDNAAIFGAGDTGMKLIESLRQLDSMKPVALFDDDPALSGRQIGGLKIGRTDQMADRLKALNVKYLLLAKPNLAREKRLELVKLLEPLDVEMRIVPDMKDIASGRALISETRPINIHDLLGRAQVPARQDLIDKAVSGNCVLITGAGGSIGSELARQVTANNAREIVLLDSSEFAMFEIHRELTKRVSEQGWEVIIHPVLGSVTDEAFLANLFSQYSFDIVFHAAAYKHVHLVEQNSGRAILNNSLGTLYLARTARNAGVARFVLISTDKAVRPKGIMGGTKRLAELIMQAADTTTNDTVFTAVRFGNVLDSSGSVVPLFREQIANGGPVTVTDPKVERYFMLIPEAAQLVIQAGAMARGGEVFLLKMGKPVLILDLARTMIKLAGHSVRGEGSEQGGDIEIVFTRLKKGEKMFEELFIGDNIEDTAHEQILLCNETHLSWKEIKEILQDMEKLLATSKDQKALDMLKNLCMHEDSPAQTNNQ